MSWMHYTANPPFFRDTLYVGSNLKVNVTSDFLNKKSDFSKQTLQHDSLIGASQHYIVVVSCREIQNYLFNFCHG